MMLLVVKIKNRKHLIAFRVWDNCSNRLISNNLAPLLRIIYESYSVYMPSNVNAKFVYLVLFTALVYQN